MLPHAWISLPGSTTSDNRDYCGISKHADAVLFIIADGSTSGPQGGELATQLVHEIVDRFSTLGSSITKESICELLRNIHAGLRRMFPADTASYAILVEKEGNFLSLHAGDCRIGIRRGQIEWLTSPHILISALGTKNEENISNYPSRHFLTRGFRPKRFETPECIELPNLSNKEIILATDGFWADLPPSRQLQILDGGVLTGEVRRDDQSCLVLGKNADVLLKLPQGKNIYIR